MTNEELNRSISESIKRTIDNKIKEIYPFLDRELNEEDYKDFEISVFDGMDDEIKKQIENGERKIIIKSSTVLIHIPTGNKYRLE